MSRIKYTKELLEDAVKQASSVSSLLLVLGLKVSGGSHRGVSQKLKAYQIDTSHFTGPAWSKGKTAETDERVREVSNRLRHSDEDVFKLGSTYPLSKLGKRLKKIGVPYFCDMCGLTEWLKAPITLHVDHINGNIADARLENLRFLCPNCHQQTDTWGAKDRTKRNGSVVES